MIEFEAACRLCGSVNPGAASVFYNRLSVIAEQNGLHSKITGPYPLEDQVWISPDLLIVRAAFLRYNARERTELRPTLSRKKESLVSAMGKFTFAEDDVQLDLDTLLADLERDGEFSGRLIAEAAAARGRRLEDDEDADLEDEFEEDDLEDEDFLDEDEDEDLYDDEDEDFLDDEEEFLDDEDFDA
jgi:hypothetical protein